MVILHIGLTEYDSIEELRNAFYLINEKETKNEHRLASSKQKAEEHIMHQFCTTNRVDNRVFWYSKCTFKNKTTYVLYEAIFD